MPDESSNPSTLKLEFDAALGEHAIHFSVLVFGLTFAFCAACWCYYLLSVMFVAGRIVALPTGLICAMVAAYASQYYLSSIEATFYETHEIEAMYWSDWKEWYWTLPSTLGMLAWGGFIAYFLSLPFPGVRWVIVCGFVFLSYPFFQLSTLETESPLKPFSANVARTYLSNPLAWLLFYLFWLVVFSLSVGILAVSVSAFPLLPVLLIGPITASIVVGYALALGRLAHYFQETIDEDESIDE